MKQFVDGILSSVKNVVTDRGLAEKAAGVMEEVQASAPWLVKAASRLPLAPKLLGPLMVLSRYRKGGKVELPPEGLSAETIRGMLDTYRAYDMGGGKARVFAYYYDAGPEAEEVCHNAYLRYLGTNGLDPTVTPSVMALENELIELAKQHVSAGPQVVGNFTSGGTESIIMAVKTARDWARANLDQIEKPEMILPVTAHAAFHKAAAYLCVKPVPVEVDPVTFRADPARIREAITDNTILLVGSAPSYAHGVVDPIRQIAKLAKEHGLLCHVDACVGGFILHWFKELGHKVPDYDFTVEGVTSMSMDLHKYGFAAKGASIVLYKDKELRRHQIFACSGWTGYTIVNATMQSSKTGGPVAGAWAVMNFLGRKGYLDLARQILDGSKILQEGLAKIPGLRILGEPDMNLIAVTSDTVNVFRVADEMRKRNWYIQPQLGLGAHRENFHFSVSAQNVPMIPDLLKDLAESVEAVKDAPESGLAERIRAQYGELQHDQLTEKIFWRMLGMAGIKGVEIPERMAEINEILNALKPELADALLKRFFNEINKFASA